MYTCTKCGAGMRKRSGQRGSFYGCNNYPDCKHTEQCGEEDQEESFNPFALPKERPAFNHSPQTKAILDCIKNDNSNIVIMARAGTGKTTLLVEIAHNLPAGSKAGFCAFSRDIADELKKRLPRTAKAATLHSMGFSAIRRAFPNVSVDEGKVSGILDEIIDDGDCREMATRTAVIKLVGLCKSTLTPPTDHKALSELADRFEIVIDAAGQITQAGGRNLATTAVNRERVFDLVEKCLYVNNQRTHVIDYDDMVYFPSVLNLDIEKFDFMMVDESQDMSLSQQEMILRCAKRLVCVGDDRQAIFAFRGADGSSMERMTRFMDSMDNGVKSFPLNMTRRCPVSHVALAKRIVPDFQAIAGAPAGSVRHVSEPASLDMMKPGCMVICRTNAPLVALAYQLIRRNIPAIVKGSDIGTGLINLIAALKPSDVDNLGEKLDKYVVKERLRLINAKANTGTMTAFEDKCNTLRKFRDASEDLSDLRARIGKVFSDSKRTDDKVVLSSVHRAKGLESEDVFIFCPDTLPHPAAKQEEDIEQELNIAYVAVTRSKKNLVFVGASSRLFGTTPEPYEEDVFSERNQTMTKEQVEMIYQDIHQMTSEKDRESDFLSLATDEFAELAKRNSPLIELIEEIETLCKDTCDRWRDAGYFGFQIINNTVLVNKEKKDLLPGHVSWELREVAFNNSVHVLREHWIDVFDQKIKEDIWNGKKA